VKIPFALADAAIIINQVLLFLILQLLGVSWEALERRLRYKVAALMINIVEGEVLSVDHVGFQFGWGGVDNSFLLHIVLDGDIFVVVFLLLLIARRDRA
jgi:hypothetical protein